MGQEVEDRGQWTGKLDFVLSCLGFAVGLGNVWRFPYQCYKYGGGAFLLPYTLMLFFIGIPCFFLEIAIGQYSGMGPMDIYKNLSPLFKGLTFTNILGASISGIYYNLIIAWTVYYLFASLTSKLPWDSCENAFNSEYCFNINDYKDCQDQRNATTIPSESVYFLGRCLTNKTVWETLKSNISYYCDCGGDQVYINERICGSIEEFPTDDFGNPALFDTPIPLRKSAAFEYWKLAVLNESDGISNMGPIQWKLCLCYLFSWIVIFLCMIKGIKTSGKVVYFTATYPYFVLVILLIKALTLPGAYEGIRFYIVPDWSKLADFEIWEAAAIQIFFSLSIGGGGLVTLASYNSFKNNVIRDTAIVCIGNCLTSVFAGFAIFSVLGFMANELGLEVPDVAKNGGPGLAFIAYPDLVTRFGASAPFWSILFFSMLFTLGLDSEFAIVETVTTGILDYAPSLRSKKSYIIAIVCLTGFLLGLPLTTRGGGYLLVLLDRYKTTWANLLTGFCELIIIAHLYGVDEFFSDIKCMVKHDMGPWLKTNIYFIFMTLSPAIIGVILLNSWISFKPLTRGTYTYPDWATAMSVSIGAVLILAILIEALIIYGNAIYVESKKPEFNLIRDGPRIFKELTKSTDAYKEHAKKAMIDGDCNAEQYGHENNAAEIED